MGQHLKENSKNIRSSLRKINITSGTLIPIDRDFNTSLTRLHESNEPLPIFRVKKFNKLQNSLDNSHTNTRLHIKDISFKNLPNVRYSIDFPFRNGNKSKLEH